MKPYVKGGGSCSEMKRWRQTPVKYLLVLNPSFPLVFNTILHFKTHEPGYRGQTTQRADTTCPGSRGLLDNPEQGHLTTSLLKLAARLYFSFCCKCLALTHTQTLSSVVAAQAFLSHQLRTSTSLILADKPVECYQLGIMLVGSSMG